MTRTWQLAILYVGVVLVVVGLVLTTTRAGAAPGDLQTVQVSSVHCGPVYCWQHKVVTIHEHGIRTIVATYGHRRPVESKTTWTTPAFTRYALRAVVVMPVQS